MKCVSGAAIENASRARTLIGRGKTALRRAGAESAAARTARTSPSPTRGYPGSPSHGIAPSMPKPSGAPGRMRTRQSCRSAPSVAQHVFRKVECADGDAARRDAAGRSPSRRASRARYVGGIVGHDAEIDRTSRRRRAPTPRACSCSTRRSGRRARTSSNRSTSTSSSPEVENRDARLFDAPAPIAHPTDASTPSLRRAERRAARDGERRRRADLRRADERCARRRARREWRRVSTPPSVSSTRMHRIGAVGNRRARHDANRGAAARARASARSPGAHRLEHRQHDRRVRARRGDVRRAHGVAVHRRVVPRRMLDRRAHVFGEHAAERVAQRERCSTPSGADAGENARARLVDGERHAQRSRMRGETRGDRVLHALHRREWARSSCSRES